MSIVLHHTFTRNHPVVVSFSLLQLFDDVNKVKNRAATTINFEFEWKM